MNLAHDCTERKDRVCRAVKQLIIPAGGLVFNRIYSPLQLDLIKYLLQLPIFVTRVDYSDTFGRDIDKFFTLPDFFPSIMYPKPLVSSDTVGDIVETIQAFGTSCGFMESVFIEVQANSVFSPKNREDMTQARAILDGSTLYNDLNIPLLFRNNKSYDELSTVKLDVEVAILEGDIADYSDLRRRGDEYKKQFSGQTLQDRLALNRTAANKRMSQENIALASIIKTALVNKVVDHGDGLLVPELTAILKSVELAQKIEKQALGLSVVPKNNVDEHYDTSVGIDDASDIIRTMSSEELTVFARVGDNIRRRK